MHRLDVMDWCRENYSLETEVLLVPAISETFGEKGNNKVKSMNYQINFICIALFAENGHQEA